MARPKTTRDYGVRHPMSTKVGYKYEPQCVICNSVYQDSGVPMREDLEKIYYETRSSSKVNELLKKNGMDLSLNKVANHMKRHAPYTLFGKTQDGVSKLFMEVADKQAKADDILDYIITEGFKRLQNGSMIISERLLLGALKIASENKKLEKYNEGLDLLQAAWLQSKKTLPTRKVEDIIDGEVEKEAELLKLEGENIESTS